MKSMKRFLPEFLFLVMFLPSCSSKVNYNAAFEKKYGQDVEKIKVDRTQSKESQTTVTVLQPPTEEDLRAMNSQSDQGYYAYVDVSRFGEKTPQKYLPNGEFYEQLRVNNPGNSLPPNIFEISYDTRLYPAFRKAGAEFDRIPIPSADVYGVKTEMSEKPYLLVGNDVLKKTVDQIIAERTAEDVEFSEILIKEQKQLSRQQRMKKTFGDEVSLEVALLEKTKEQPNRANEVKMKSNSSKDQKTQNGDDFLGSVQQILKN
jgi:hypothetical protein